MDKRSESELKELKRIIEEIEGQNDPEASFDTLNNKIEKINSVIYRIDKLLRDKELKNQIHDRTAVMINGVTVNYLNSNGFLSYKLNDSLKLLEMAYKFAASNDLSKQIKENINKVKKPVKEYKKLEKKHKSKKSFKTGSPLLDLMQILDKFKNVEGIGAMPILISEIDNIIKATNELDKNSNSEIFDVTATIILNTTITYLNSIQNSLDSVKKEQMEGGLKYLIIAYRIAVSSSLQYDIKKNIKIVKESALYLGGLSPVKAQIQAESFVEGLDKQSNRIILFFVNNLYVSCLLIAGIGAFLYAYFTNSWDNQQIFPIIWIAVLGTVILIVVISWIWDKIKEENEANRRMFGRQY